MQSAVRTLRGLPTTILIGGAALVAVAIAAIVLLLLPGSSTAPPFNGIGYPNGDASNTRAVGGPIRQATVSQLKPAWRHPLKGRSLYGIYAASPVIRDGVIYSQDLLSNVQAISVRTGETLWSKTYGSPDQGPNGVVVARGRVFGATATSAFALDQRTGRQLWSVQLVRNDQDGIDMAPGYRDGLVYVSTVPGNNRSFYNGGAVGILFALDAATGRKVWQFDTAPIERWSPQHTDINLGGGLWHAPAFDDRGGMYFGVGNAGPFPGTEDHPWGSSRPGRDLYTDSLVKLDAATGRLRWYYQLTPHDLYDWDLQDPPILARVKGRPVVITAGKAGIVIAVDRRSGHLLWRRAVGTHNGHDDDPLLAMRRQYAKLHTPEEVYPGLLGGVIAPMSTDGSTVFVPVVNHSVIYSKQTEPQEGASSTGEVVALDVATGKVKWTQALDTPAFGATTVANDLVFATTAAGLVYAFDTRTGDIAWQAQLPAGTNTGVAIDGDTVIAPAGLSTAAGQTPSIVAYRLSSAASGR